MSLRRRSWVRWTSVTAAICVSAACGAHRTAQVLPSGTEFRHTGVSRSGTLACIDGHRTHRCCLRRRGVSAAFVPGLGPAGSVAAESAGCAAGAMALASGTACRVRLSRLSRVSVVCEGVHWSTIFHKSHRPELLASISNTCPCTPDCQNCVRTPCTMHVCQTMSAGG